MGKLGNARRKFVRVGLAAGLLGGVLVGVASSPVEAVREPGTGKNNPDLAASCGTDVILVLDESGSIASAGAIGQVESAVVAFVDGLNGTGSRMRIVEFATNARDATLEPAPNGNAAFQEVNDAFATKVDTYLAAGGEAGLSYNYNPGVGSGQQNTNWEAGLFEAANPAAQPPIGTGTGAPLVVFITDGNPNTIGTAGTSTPNNGGGSNASRDAAIEEIEALQGAGNHVLSVAVGNAFSDGAAYERLKNITEPNTTYLDVWEGTGPLDIRKTEVVGVQSFDALENALREVVFALCAPSVSINKINQAGAAVPNWPFSLSVEELTDPAGGNPVGSEPFVWVTPSAGSTTAPSTESRTTALTSTEVFGASFRIRV